jgi:transposase
MLLRQGYYYGRPAWTKLHHRGGRSCRGARRDRLTGQIEAILPDWNLAPVVAALQTMRGMALVMQRR